MKIKLSEIVNNIENIRALQEVKLPVKVSYRLKRLTDKLQSPLKTYDEKRNELVKEFGDEQEDKTFAVKDPEKLKLFMMKFNDLVAIEEEVDFDKIKIDDLGDVKVEAKLLVDFIFE